jgi:hypothetical protein
LADEIRPSPFSSRGINAALDRQLGRVRDGETVAFVAVAGHAHDSERESRRRLELRRVHGGRREAAASDGGRRVAVGTVIGLLAAIAAVFVWRVLCAMERVVIRGEFEDR